MTIGIRKTHTWDVFCRVIDYFGDAGVCWRLAKELACEHRATVRLWIDDLTSLVRLNPAVRLKDEQSVDGVRVCRWRDRFPGVPAADIVIDAFGCGLPEPYVEAMAAADRTPLWIVLEYLSAETWVAGHHGRPSPHPRLALERYFFFPGFVRGTGGLLREADLFERRDRWNARRSDAFWQSLGFIPPAVDALTISLFGYENAPLPELLNAWRQGTGQIVVAVPDGPLVGAIERAFGHARLSAGAVLNCAHLEVRILPFVPQERYDELLWACDCNFVRGEDSFVRAQWAARPFVWHVYPQAEHLHAAKLDAFLNLYGEDLAGDARNAAGNFMRVWNHFDVPGVTVAAAWQAFAAELGVLRCHGRRWSERIAGVGELAGNLASFCFSKLQ
jgi:uncharacterized repeat protein (TIGR03837 family)